jgi:ADP-ribosylglycohydrolase
MIFCDGLSDDLDAALLRVGHVLAWVDEEAAMRHIGQGWSGEQVVALALYCVLRYTDDYAGCVRRAANFSGNSASIACIAGGILGARLGTLEAIPMDWIERCENRVYLLDLGRRLGGVM